MLLTLPVVIIVAIFFGKFIKRLSKETQDEIAASNVIVQEVLTGIVNVKAFANEWFERKRYINKVKNKKSGNEGSCRDEVPLLALLFFSFLERLPCDVPGCCNLCRRASLLQSIFSPFLLMTGLVAGSIGGLAAEFGQVQKGLGAVESLMGILNERREFNDFESDSKEVSLSSDLVFSGVNFHYDQRPDVPVLSDFNLTIKEGEQVALVGPSGAGKSTVAALVLRFQNQLRDLSQSEEKMSKTLT